MSVQKKKNSLRSNCWKQKSEIFRLEIKFYFLTMRAIYHCQFLRITDQSKWEIHLYSWSGVAESQNGWGWKWLHGGHLLQSKLPNVVICPAQARLSGSSCPGLCPDPSTWIPSGPLLPRCSLDGCAQHLCIGLFLCTFCWISHLQKRF